LGPVAGCYEHSNEPSGSMRVLKDYVPWSQYIFERYSAKTVHDGYKVSRMTILRILVASYRFLFVIWKP
jgi:hypothetical protein